MAAGNTYGRPVRYGRSRTLGPIGKVGRALLGQGISPERRPGLGVDRYWTEIAPDSPIGFWPLSETTGTSAAEFVADRTMTYRNSPTLGTAGLPTGGITFNGTNQAADTASQPALNNATSGDHSTEMWIRYTTSGTSIQTAFAWRGTGGVASDEISTITVNNGVSGRIQVNSVHSGTLTRVVVNSDGGWNDGQWHHVVSTAANGGNLTLYVDGVSQGTNSASRFSDGAGADPRVCVGANIASSTTFSQLFAGDVSCVAIYDTILSPTRVLAHYRAMADSVSF